MRVIVPRRPAPGEAHESLVHECGCLQSLARLLVNKLGSRQLSKFGIDKWQQLLRRLRIAAFNVAKYLCEI